MKIHSATLTILFAGLCSSAGARDYWHDLEAFKKRTPNNRQKTEVERLLRLHPSSPETYILAANWYWNDGHHIMVMPQDLPDGIYTPEVADPKLFGEKTLAFGDAGVFRDEFIPNQASRRRAIAILDIARSKFPNRLDIHLGLRSQLNQLNEIDREIEAIEEFVAATKRPGEQLLWEYGEPLKKSPREFVEKILLEILDENSKRSTSSEQDLFVAVARIIVRECPESEVAWTFLSVACWDRGDAAGRYKALRRGLAIAPNDTIILKNWLDINFRLQLLLPARDAANRILKANPDSGSKEYAEAMLKTLDHIEE